MARKPAPRTKDGKYINRIDGRDEIAIKAIDELCSLNPEVDIIDIHFQFLSALNYHFSRRIAIESKEM